MGIEPAPLYIKGTKKCIHLGIYGINLQGEDRVMTICRCKRGLNSIDVVLHVEKIQHKAEATVNAKGVTLHAHAETDNMYASIDDLTDKLDSQVRKHKEKITDHHQNGGALKDQMFEQEEI